MSIKVTISKAGVKDKVVEPFDVYRHKDGEYYVALVYSKGIYLHMLSVVGNRWSNNTTFGDRESEFKYVGKLSEVVVKP